LLVKSSSYFEQVVKAVSSLERPLQTIVCLALGKFSESLLSRFQLAFLLLLREKLKIPVEICDPAFTQLELSMLKDFRLFIIPNTRGSFPLSRPTLFFLPHSSHQLTNNVLFSNWEPSRLPYCILLSNELSTIREDVIFRRNPEKLEYILKSESVAQVVNLEDDFEYANVFSETAIHYFPESECSKMKESFWNQHEPRYIDPDVL